jgi:hypothetical protein
MDDSRGKVLRRGGVRGDTTAGVRGRQEAFAILLARDNYRQFAK